MVLGFDFGMKYIGVATGQTITKTATPLISIKAVDGIPNWDEIANLIETWHPEALIVGSPLNMDGSMQQMTHNAHKFANRLKHKYKLPVHMVDERLSTWEAKQDLDFKSNLTPLQLLQLNAQAAAIVLQQWLNQ